MSTNLRIRFRCHACEKPLSIGRKKAGANVTCPSCKEKLVVPDAEDLSDDPEPENPFEEFQVYDDLDDTDLVYADPDQSNEPELQLNSRLSVPRKIIYLQGLMLGLVAISFFLLGLLIGNTTSGTKGNNSNKSVLSGTVTWKDGARSTPDEGAVVFLLPAGKRPEIRFDSEELIPGRLFTSSNPEVQLIRDFGGNVCTVNRSGFFELTVSSKQEYVLFVISKNGERSGNLDSRFHEEIGQYFTSVETLTEDRVCFVKRVKPLNASELLGEIELDPRT